VIQRGRSAADFFHNNRSAHVMSAVEIRTDQVRA
jgi:hypothetical protein